MKYDLIGDIHGHSERLIELLTKLDYQPVDGVYRHPRHQIRMKWWDASARTYRAAFLGPDSALSHIPEDPIDVDHLINYSSDEPPVFIGHYWMDSEPALLAPNVACLDYSVAAKRGGKLVAYRWDGEQQLSGDKFVYVVK